MIQYSVVVNKLDSIAAGLVTKDLDRELDIDILYQRFIEIKDCLRRRL